jgi:hypothetical protein
MRAAHPYQQVQYIGRQDTLSSDANSKAPSGIVFRFCASNAPVIQMESGEGPILKLKLIL